MTDEALKAIAERAEKATPGPWDDVLSNWSVRALCNGPDHGLYICDVSPVHGGDDRPHDGNKEFIACARSDVPALLTHAAEQAATILSLRELLEAAKVERDGAVLAGVKAGIAKARAAVTGEHLDCPPDNEIDRGYEAAIGYSLAAIAELDPAAIAATVKVTP